MSTQFICKNCKAESYHIDAVFHLQLVATYSNDGRDYRQRAIRVTGCDLTTDLEFLVTTCHKCKTKGSIKDLFDTKEFCDKCGEEISRKRKGGYCEYNSGFYCVNCYKQFKMSCDGCPGKSACTLYDGKKPPKKRRTSTQIKAEKVRYERAREIARELGTFEAVEDSDGTMGTDTANITFTTSTAGRYRVARRSSEEGGGWYVEEGELDE